MASWSGNEDIRNMPNIWTKNKQILVANKLFKYNSSISSWSAKWIAQQKLWSFGLHCQTVLNAILYPSMSKNVLVNCHVSGYTAPWGQVQRWLLDEEYVAQINAMNNVQRPLIVILIISRGINKQ